MKKSRLGSKLKSTCAIVAAVLSASAALVTPTIQAHAATPSYCAHYASLAVWQFNRNRSIPGCFKGADGTWHADYERHYGWCVTAAYEAAREADAYRGMRLHQCMFRAYGHY